MNTFEVTEYIHDDSLPEPELHEYKVQVEYYKDSRGNLWEFFMQPSEDCYVFFSKNAVNTSFSKEEFDAMEKVTITETYWD